MTRWRSRWGRATIVYRAFQPSFDRMVAVKVITGFLRAAEGRQRFEHECQAIGRLSGHPNVATVYDSGLTPVAANSGLLVGRPHGASSLEEQRLPRGGKCCGLAALALVIRRRA